MPFKDSTATLRGDLQEVVQEYGSGLLTELMGAEIIGPVSVPLKSSQFAKISAEETEKKTNSVKRAPTSKYSRLERKVTSDTYTCEERGQEEPIDDAENMDLSRYFDCEADSANNATRVVLTEQEKDIRTLLWNTGLFTSTYQQAVTGGAWSAPTTAKVAKDVLTAITKLKKNLGGIPGGVELRLAMNETVFNNVANTDDILDRVKYVGVTRQAITKAAIAQALGVDKVVTSSFAEGGTDIWSTSYALLYLFSNSRMFKSSPRLGNIFTWEQMQGAGQYVVETCRDETISSNVVRAKQWADEKILNVRCGILITGV